MAGSEGAGIKQPPSYDLLAPTEARGKNIKPQDLIDARHLTEMEKSGFFDQLWSKK